MIKRRLPRLGKRLDASRQMAGDFQTFADIGADHGILSAVLLAEDERKRAVVADISEAALSKAVRRLALHGLDSRAEFRVTDGLSALEGRTVDTVFILGMGGDTISGILKRGNGYLNGAELIVSGQTEIELLRQTVYDISYHLAQEQVVWDGNRPYILLKCLPGKEALPEEKLLYLGPLLTQAPSPDWLRWLEKQRSFLTAGVRSMEQSFGDAERLMLFRKKLCWVESALANGKEEVP